MKKSASAIWQGSLKEGTGSLSTGSGALQGTPYGFNTRFEDSPGSNPEELIGAAHAGCFSMAFSNMLGQEGFTPERIETRAEVSLEKLDSGFTITAVALTMTARIPGISAEQFQSIAGKAKDGCPVSRLLDCEISLSATLQG